MSLRPTPLIRTPMPPTTPTIPMIRILMENFLSRTPESDHASCPGKETFCHDAIGIATGGDAADCRGSMVEGALGSSGEMRSFVDALHGSDPYISVRIRSIEVQ